MRLIRRLILAIVVFLIALAVLVRVTTLHPAEIEAAEVACSPSTPTITAQQPLKILDWNVQYMAGKNYVFFYDPPNGDGPDERPSRADIEATYTEVVRIITDEQPDLILLQEVDEGAERTDDEDQAARLRSLLPDYPCYSETFYWRNSFTPHPRIWGSAGMKLVVLSRYQISSAIRHQLAIMPEDPVSSQFNLKRAILEVRLPMQQGGEIAIMTTHLDAFAQGNDTMQKQVDEVQSILQTRTNEQIPWLIAGDFNLLPNEQSYQQLPPDLQPIYNPQTEITPLLDEFSVFPSVKDMASPQAAQWYTHFPNLPNATKPDRTIDYVFYSPQLSLIHGTVRNTDTLKISDHLPLITEFNLGMTK